MRTAIAAAALAVTALAGCASAATGTTAKQAPAPYGTTFSASAAAAAPTPAAAASPDGTYRGSCDYELYSGMRLGAVFVGEVDLHNTGNIGTVVRARISWPQEGYPYVTATKTARTQPGQRMTVRFHYAATETQLNLLQSWQEGHAYRDGCRYRATILRTFGTAR